jgi:tetratricopeptide (TPR) repeat protein
VTIRLEHIPGSFKLQKSFPRLQWDKIDLWLQGHCQNSETEEARTGVARQWLERLKSHLGAAYEAYESDNFLILSSAGLERARCLVEVAERARSSMAEGLPGLFKKVGAGKIVCLAFDDADTYYRYIAPFYPSGEFPATGGVFLQEGYSHFALNSDSQSQLERALVHELTHALLTGRCLPLWLEEAVTQLMEETVLATVPFRMTREELIRQQKFWRRHGLACFWYGQSFHRPDNGSTLSYTLSQVMARNMLSTDRKKFLKFLQSADPLDGGDQASRVIFGLSLGDWAAQFLGKGHWESEPRKPQEFYYRGRCRQGFGAYDAAAADFRQAIALGSKDAQHFNDLAWLLATCSEERIRNGGEAVRMATQACELTKWASWPLLDTLAAGYAEQGDFKHAVTWAEKALALAPREEKKPSKSRLNGYRAGRPHRPAQSI